MAVTSKITGISFHHPERLITNEDVLKLLIEHSRGYLTKEDLETLIAKAKRLLGKAGNETRYWCQEHEYGTDIAKIAAESALEDAGVAADQIDLIIYTGMSKAFVEPATAHVLRHEIGAINSNVIDTQDACTSFMKSLEIATALIKTGSYKKILIAAGERTYDWADFSCKTVEELAWKFGSMTIGDAAGAFVVEPTDDPAYVDDYRHMNFFYKIADGSYSTCHIGLNHRVGDRYRLYSHSSRLIRTGLTLVMELLVDLLNREQWKDFRFDNLFIHDIGKIIDDMMIPFMREAQVFVPDNYKSYFPKYGNVASVSLPMAMWHAKKEGRLKEGNIVVYIAPAAGVQAGVFVFKF